MTQHILSLSYGKDSMACLFALEKLGWPLDRIVTADVWATDTIPADLPPMVEFKAYADAAIKERWGIEVEHFKSKVAFERGFYTLIGERAKPEYRGKPRGWPGQVLANWCNRDLKQPAFRAANKDGGIYYIGIASDEPDRFHNLSETKLSPLVEIGWTETDCLRICKENTLLSPIYTSATRGGCWFCPNQTADQLRLLRRNYPDLWALMLKWDDDSPVTFKADGHTVHDFDRRFAMEEQGLIPTDRTFRWAMLEIQPKFLPFVGEQMQFFEGGAD